MRTNKEIENLIRNFGMSGYLLTCELSRIEKQSNITLGHTPRSATDNTTTYYPQFERSVRSEASEMSRHYELLYCLENSIRKLISETLVESDGVTWWETKRITVAIKTAVEKRIQTEITHPFTRRSEFPIAYTTFGELSEIITSNWDIFGTIFSDQNAVRKVMANLNQLRGQIAHCCPMAEDEINRLFLTVKDWFRIMGPDNSV